MLRKSAVASLILQVCLNAASVSAAEVPRLDQQDTIVVRADQAWESDDGDVLNFEGNFELTAPDYYLKSDTAELHGAMEDPSTIIADGQPVQFWVQDDSGRKTHGEGARLEYHRDQNLLRLSGKAVLRDEHTVMRSSMLEYDTANRRLVGTGNDGVQIVTQPKAY